MNDKVTKTLVEDKIKEACLKMIADGWQIEDDCFIEREIKCCCPLVALAMVEGSLSDKDRIDEVCELALALKLDKNEVISFVCGFDNVDVDHAGNTETIRMGKRISNWIKSLPKEVSHGA